MSRILASAVANGSLIHLLCVRRRQIGKVCTYFVTCATGASDARNKRGRQMAAPCNVAPRFGGYLSGIRSSSRPNL